eukprot:CAMPEP_0113708190 /NCGR_PEP_ID=MMETSP0038_2-20120614/28831_1 /TAXON_ID=2898 /ORGANISM="Cryptomonas paramecium" /LENGTH=60 /DNA_ID=CAMNT_0000633843 /DNA_START=317 /DNA_END=499 /DNA_ORIENTATION=- /assembly_acc=CAM_ASM_000170
MNDAIVNSVNDDKSWFGSGKQFSVPASVSPLLAANVGHLKNANAVVVTTRTNSSVTRDFE